MNNNVEKYLPLGSVVLLKEAKKRIMVIGYMGKAMETGEQIFDYIGCLYPEGILSSDKNLMFNHEQIDKVFYLGLVDNEETGFMDKLKALEIEIKSQTAPAVEQSVQQPVVPSVQETVVAPVQELVQPVQTPIQPFNPMVNVVPEQSVAPQTQATTPINPQVQQNPFTNNLFDNINQ